MLCGCGKEITSRGKTFHENGKQHKEWAASVPPESAAAAPIITETVPAEVANVIMEEVPAKVPVDDLDHDLRSPVQDVKNSPERRAKAVRMAFSHRGWANGSLGPFGTVRNFCETYGIPVKDTIRTTT
jgi:hypothetical protein